MQIRMPGHSNMFLKARSQMAEAAVYVQWFLASLAPWTEVCGGVGIKTASTSYLELTTRASPS